MRNVKAALEKSANLGKPISPEVIVIATNMEEPGRLADLTASNLDLKVEGAQEILESIDPVERLRRVKYALAGTPDQVRAEVEALQTLYGSGGELEWFGWFFDQGFMSWDETQRQFEIFAKEIIPHFR